MNAFDLYCKYISLKLHFTNDKFDYNKYGDSKKVSVETFYKRKDQFYFTKLCKKYSSVEIQDFLLSNLIENPQIWVGDLVKDDCDVIYKKFVKTKDSMYYTFEQDMSYLSNYILHNNITFDKLFHIVDDYPIICKMVMRKEITYQSFIILDIILNLKYNEKYNDDLIWKETMGKYYRYKCFVSLSNDDIKKYKNLAKGAFSVVSGA